MSRPQNPTNGQVDTADNATYNSRLNRWELPEVAAGGGTPGTVTGSSTFARLDATAEFLGTNEPVSGTTDVIVRDTEDNTTIYTFRITATNVVLYQTDGRAGGGTFTTPVHTVPIPA